MIKFSLFKLSIKGRVLLTFKDFIFILTWLFFLLCIADAMHGQDRGMTIFLTVWEILGIVYAFKIFDYYQVQKNEIEITDISANKNSTEYSPIKETKTAKAKFFEA